MTGPVWLFVPLFVLYILLYTGIEVLFIAVCIDAYFGYGSAVPFLYTGCTAVLLLVIDILRPQLWMYNK